MKLKSRQKTRGKYLQKYGKELIASIVRMSKNQLKILLSQRKIESRIIS